MANDTADLATPKEVAAQLSIASSTLRAWSKHFASELSTYANPPKGPTGRVGRRLYNPADVAILARARDLLASGLTFERTLAVLRTEPQTPATVQEPRALALPELAQALQVIADQRQQIADLDRRVQELENRRPFWGRSLGR